VQVGAAVGDYAVTVGRGLLKSLPTVLQAVAPGRRVALISDSNVGALHGGAAVDTLAEAGIGVRAYDFPAGEASKTRRTWSILTDRLLDDGFGRDTCVVALGGGVTTDLAGFVAATFLRGVPVVQVPTSALAMIDASVGGKTGVDVRAGKNLVGAFHAPRAVIADVEVLATLPRAERAQGLVEALKHGAILDEGHFALVDDLADRLLDGDADAFARVVLASVEIKAGVVQRDEFEGGLRQILNFGHTLGHALEAASSYRLPHGSAVAAGMVGEARMGEALGVTASGTAERLEGALRRLVGDVRAPVDPREARGYLAADKKAVGGRPRYVLLEGIGRTAGSEGWAREVPEDVVEAALASVTRGPEPAGA